MEFEKLLQINKDWEYDFKGSLLEGLTDSYSSIINFLNDLEFEYFPQWEQENDIENLDLYIEYKERILALDASKLEDEYEVILKVLRA